MIEIVREESENVSKPVLSKLRRARAMLAIVLASWSLIGLFPYNMGMFGPFPLTGPFFALLFVLGVVVLYLMTRSKRGKRAAVGKNGKWIGIVVVGILGVLVLANIGDFSGPSLLSTGPPATSGALSNSVVWSAVTSDIIGSPFTALSSLGSQASGGGTIASTTLWSAASGSTGETLQQSGNNAIFTMQTGDQTIAGGAGNKIGGKMSAWAAEVKAVWTYTNPPGATGGGAAGLPVYVYLQSIAITGASGSGCIASYTSNCNNGTATGNAQMFNLNNNYWGGAILKDNANGIDPICPETIGQSVAVATAAVAAGGCGPSSSPPNGQVGGWDANVARSTGALTIQIAFVLNAAGIFGWDTSKDMALGSSITATFVLGIPQAIAYSYGGVAYYTASLVTCQIVFLRNQA